LFLAVPWEMADVFSLKFQRNKPKKCLGYGFRQGENRIKRLYFHRTVEMKQPQAIIEPILIKISNYYCGAAFCGPARVCGCFISTVLLKPRTFSPVFSSMDSAFGLLLVIYLEFQGKKHQPLPMAYPFR
ncbi:hypothetical protein, partial [uncultured Bilophila sp.]|uniref:hypothetical protein n=1 Tax=uncultured Bilophila sp. TaxID=529385 RepID=UPI00280B147D